MSGGQVFVDVYGPILLAACLSTLGWIVRAATKARNELIGTVRRIDTTLKSNNDQMIIIQRDVDDLKRVVPTLKETVAVLAAEFNNHEEWHERHPG